MPNGVFTVLTGAWGSRASSSYSWTYLHQGARWDADGEFKDFKSDKAENWFFKTANIGYNTGNITFHPFSGTHASDSAGTISDMIKDAIFYKTSLK